MPVKTVMEKRLGRPPKEKRNMEMARLRVEDRKRWTYPALGERYGIDTKTAWEIVQRYLPQVEREIEQGS